MRKRCNACFDFFEDEYEVCPHCGYYEGAEPKEPFYLAPGTVLLNRYIIGNVCGFGGFGITYKAFDKTLDTVVAIKEYYPSGIVNRAPGSSNIIPFAGARRRDFKIGLERFIIEARNMAKFNGHKNIVNTFSYFEDNNTAYIVMEYLDGHNLEDEMKLCGGKLPYERATEIIVCVCNALKDMHKDSIIHRDISPDNIYLCKDGTVKLIDFGAARFSQGEEATKFTIILKPGFAPPEQYETISSQGPWTDIYALGATFYYSIIGEKPEESTNRKTNDILAEPHKLDSLIPVHISNAIMKAMAIDVPLRFESAGAFVQVLERKKKVKSLKKEKRSRLIKRVAGVAALLFVVASAALVFIANLDQKNDEVTLEAASISVWYPDNGSEAMKEAYNEVVKDFQIKYSSVNVELKAVPAANYEQAIAESINSPDAPNLFISDMLDSSLLENTLDLSGIVTPKELGTMYFLMSIIAKEDNNCYFLDSWKSCFPDRNQMPTGFNIPVIYINTSLVPDFKNEKIESFGEISTYLSNKSGTKLLVNESMSDDFNEVFGKQDYPNLYYGGKQDFLDGKAAFYFSTTEDFFDVRKMMSLETGIPKVLEISIDRLPSKWNSLWSINLSSENENKAALTLLDYFLADKVQSKLFGKENVIHAMPLNINSLKNLLALLEELGFVESTISHCEMSSESA